MAQFKFMTECTYCGRQFKKCYTKLQAESILKAHSSSHYDEIFREYLEFEAGIFKREITDKGIHVRTMEEDRSKPMTDKDIADKEAIKQFWDNRRSYGLTSVPEYYEIKTKGKIEEIKNEV